MRLTPAPSMPAIHADASTLEKEARLVQLIKEGLAPSDRKDPSGLLEASWRMKGPSGRVLECGIHRHVAGVEVRCGYGEDDLLRSQTAPEIGTARDIAEQWRQAVLAKGGFEHIR